MENTQALQKSTEPSIETKVPIFRLLVSLGVGLATLLVLLNGNVSQTQRGENGPLPTPAYLSQTIQTQTIIGTTISSSRH